jgi:hypothetical protein
MSVQSLFVGFLSLVSIVNAAPQVSFGSATGKVKPGQCEGQSCEIAAASGSTGDLPNIVPVGSKLVSLTSLPLRTMLTVTQ